MWVCLVSFVVVRSMVINGAGKFACILKSQTIQFVAIHWPYNRWVVWVLGVCNGKYTDFVRWNRTCPWCTRPFFLTQQCLWTASTKSIKTISFFGVAMIHPEMKHFQNPTTYIRIIPWVSSKLKVVIKLLARTTLEYVPRRRKYVRNTHYLFCSSYRLIPFNILIVFFLGK